MMSEWVYISDIAKELGIPQNTIRRYCDTFGEFLPSVKQGRSTKYKVPESREVLARIRSLYEEGYQTDDIQRLLQQDTPTVLDVTIDDHHAPTLSTTEVVRELLAQHNRMVQEVAAGLHQEIDELRATLAAKDQAIEEAIKRAEVAEQRASAAEEKAEVAMGNAVTAKELGSELRDEIRGQIDSSNRLSEQRHQETVARMREMLEQRQRQSLLHRIRRLWKK
jgi:DNA-binding transcriptional MerR regulator